MTARPPPSERPTVPARTRELAADPLALDGAPSREVLAFLTEAARAIESLGEPTLVRFRGDDGFRVIGDTHGDYASAHAAMDRPEGPSDRPFVAVGDYIDRATRSEPRPAALPLGSLWNLLFLVARKLVEPDRVILLQGNHESARRLPVPGPTYLRELRERFPRPEALALWRASFEVVERLPLAALSSNGVFLAHGGIPPPGAPPADRWRRDDLDLLEGLVWGDPANAYEDRGIGFAFHEPELVRFLHPLPASVLVRGHDPKHSGTSLYHGACLTLQTSDLFRRFGHGGILRAEVPAAPRIRGAEEIAVEELVDGAWRPYAIRVIGAPGPRAGAGGE